MLQTTRYSNWITSRWKNVLEQTAKQSDSETALMLEKRLAEAIVVCPEELLEGRVQFGSLVTVFSIEDEEEQTFQIVSRDEADSAPGLLSEGSPLAQAIFGAREGEVAQVSLANGSKTHYEITHIRIPK